MALTEFESHVSTDAVNCKEGKLREVKPVQVSRVWESIEDVDISSINMNPIQQDINLGQSLNDSSLANCISASSVSPNVKLVRQPLYSQCFQGF